MIKAAAGKETSSQNASALGDILLSTPVDRLVTDRGLCLWLGIGITGGWEGKGKAGKVSSAGSGCSPGLLSSGPTTPVLTKGQGGNKIRL